MTATVLAFPTPAPKDGGKARIRLRRERFGLAAPMQSDLTMRHADPEDTAPVEYSAPQWDSAMTTIALVALVSFACGWFGKWLYSRSECEACLNKRLQHNEWVRTSHLDLFWNKPPRA
jgi:hypothetical protein